MDQEACACNNFQCISIDFCFVFQNSWYILQLCEVLLILSDNQCDRKHLTTNKLIGYYGGQLILNPYNVGKVNSVVLMVVNWLCTLYQVCWYLLVWGEEVSCYHMFQTFGYVWKRNIMQCIQQLRGTRWYVMANCCNACYCCMSHCSCCLQLGLWLSLLS